MITETVFSFQGVLFSALSSSFGYLILNLFAPSCQFKKFKKLQSKRKVVSQVVDTNRNRKFQLGDSTPTTHCTIDHFMN